MMKPSHALKAGIIVSIAVVILFVFSAAAPAMSSSQASAFTSQTNANLLPNPVLSSNITWSSFNSQWAPLEYSNGTNMKNLTANLNTEYANPITINTADISSTSLHKAVDGQYYNSTTPKIIYQAPTAGSIFKHGTKGTTIYMEENGSKQGAYYAGEEIAYPVTSIPYNNPAYDFVTITGYLTGAKLTGVNAQIGITNNTTSTYPANPGITMYPTGTTEGYYLSESLANVNLTLNKASGLGIVLQLTMPAATTGIYNLTITGIAVTTYPMILGQNNAGKQITKTTGSVQLSSFKPTGEMTVTNDGYTVAVSQSIQNLTTEQSEISGNPSYVEQVTYEGSYQLPMAPDLTYSNSVISEKFNISTSQTTVLDVNGLSLLNTISSKNGTITLLTVNPNQKTTLIQIVDYTSSQWTAVSGPPGFFSVNGILYYFDELF